MNSYDVYDLTHKTGISNIELEKIISQDCSCSFRYARDVLKDRFELGEGVISKDWFYSYEYAKYVLRSRFRLGEKVMCDYSRYYYDAYDYDYLVKVMGYDHE